MVRGKEIRNKNTLSSQCIDNISGDENIANLFLNKYNQLYNSVNYDDNEMSTLSDENVNDIHVHYIANCQTLLIMFILILLSLLLFIIILILDIEFY